MSDRTAFLRAAWVNVVGNVLKIAVEGVVGLWFGSIALLADAAHSIADLLASGVVLVWGRLTYAGPDEDHPHGHERVEPLTALVVGVTLIVLAGMLLLDAAEAFLSGPGVRYSPVLIGGLAFAIADMTAVYWYTARVAAVVDSPGLRALAADCRNDIYTSLAAVVGVLGVAVGWPLLDPLAGGVVSILVAVQGFEVIRENLGYLLGKAPSAEKHEAVREQILSDPRVRGVHDLRVYYMGTELEVEFHAEVAGDMTLHEAHDLESELHRSVKRLQDVGDVHVHLDPEGIDEWEDADEA